MRKESAELGSAGSPEAEEAPPDYSPSSEFHSLIKSGLDNPTVQSSPPINYRGAADLANRRRKKAKDPGHKLVNMAKVRDNRGVKGQTDTVVDGPADRVVDGVGDGHEDMTLDVPSELLWLPSSRGMGPNYTSRVERMKQMDLKPNYVVYNMYTPVGASLLSISLGLILLILSLILFFLSGTTRVEVPYSEEDRGPLTVHLGADFKPPIYIYYKISDFYVTHKKVVYDSEPAQVANSSCKSFKTFEEILDLRCINGRNTLNGRDDWCANYKENSKFKLPVYPCGPLAATIMTDTFQICPVEVPRDERGGYAGADFGPCLDVKVQDEPDVWKFLAYSVKNQKSSQGFSWIDLTNPLYHSWLQHPYSNTFLKPYGVIYDEFAPGDYKIHLVNNLWPSKEWRAKKAIYISCVNFFGTKSLAFEIILLCTSVLYIVTGMVLLALHFKGFRLNKSPWRGLTRVKVGIVTEKEEYIRRASTAQLDLESFEVQSKGHCLCPLRH